MKEVTDLKESYGIEKIYSDVYEKRYGIAPIMSSNGSDATILKDLVRQLGLGRTTALVNGYLRMNDEWFIRTGHSLETMKKSIPAINSTLGNTQPLSKALRLSILRQCDQCEQYKVFVLPMDPDWTKRVECDECSPYK